MVISTGTVRHGAIEIPPGQLPEGAVVTILAPEGDETFELAPDDEARLVDALREVARGAVVSGPDLIAQLRRS